jgi:alpha-ribazole phosphatase
MKPAFPRKSPDARITATSDATSVSQLFLLRHGITTGHGRYCGSTDVALTQEGWQQMWAAVEGGHWARIVSSPLRRCREFAAALAERLGLPISTDARLRELHFGEWEDLSVDELMINKPQALRLFWEDPGRHAPPGAEQLDEACTRVLSYWHEASAEATGQRVLAVTHGGPMRILRAELTVLSRERLLEIEVPYATLWDTRAFLAAS